MLEPEVLIPRRGFSSPPAIASSLLSFCAIEVRFVLVWDDFIWRDAELSLAPRLALDFLDFRRDPELAAFGITDFLLCGVLIELESVFIELASLSSATCIISTICRTVLCWAGTSFETPFSTLEERITPCSRHVFNNDSAPALVSALEEVRHPTRVAANCFSTVWDLDDVCESILCIN